EANQLEGDCEGGSDDSQPDEGPPGAQAVTGDEPVSGQDAPFHSPPRCAARPFWVAGTMGTAAHLHLAVVEVRGTRLVLDVLAALTQRPIQPGDLPQGSAPRAPG